MFAGFLVTLLLVLPLLAWASVSDLKQRIIPNRLNLALAAFAPIAWAVTPVSPLEIGVRIGLAVALFALFALFMALGQMGGGDVKLGGALVLWLRPSEALPFLVHTAIAGGIVTLLTLAWHRLARRPGRPEVPYGLALVAGALAAFTQRYLNHFA